jgi:hypothetical protein
MSILSLSSYQSLLLSSSPSPSLTVSYGEVYTPLPLVNTMLDTLPPHLWSNPSLLWFEPACGLSPFLYCSYQRLMIGLEGLIPPEEERRKHILENMLYFNEIQPKNLILLKQVFQADRYKLNIFEGSFFDSIPSSFKADVIVGNPPYNMNGNKATGNIIWHKFVERALATPLLNPGGWLSFVHPPLWRKPVTARSQVKGIYELLTQQNHTSRLEMYDSVVGQMTFGCGTKYDWYVVEKRTPEADAVTTIRDEKGETHTLKLLEWPWLPNSSFSTISSLIWKEGGTRQPVLYNCFYHASHKDKIRDDMSTEFCYPLIHSTPKSGVRYKYSNFKAVKDVMFGVSKVICGESGLKSCVNDYRGEYGTTQGAFAIPIEDEMDGERLIAFLTSNEFGEVIKACTWGNYRIDWMLFGGLREGFWRV